MATPQVSPDYSTIEQESGKATREAIQLIWKLLMQLRIKVL